MSFEDMLKELQKEYIDNLANKIEEINNLLKDKNYEELQDAFHKMKGTGKTYGVPEISVLGQFMEDICKRRDNIEFFVPTSLELLQKIEVSRKQNQPFDIHSDDIFLEAQKKVA